MYPRGHAGFSLIINLPFLLYFIDDGIITLLCTLIIFWTSILPDLDISNKVILSKLDHRGITHTIEFVAISFITFNIFILILNSLLDLEFLIHTYIHISIIIGLMSHTIADTLDKHGAKISHLYSTENVKFNIIKDNSSAKLNNLLLIVGFLVTIFSYYMNLHI